MENFIEDALKKANLQKINLIQKIKPRSMSLAWLKDAPLTSAATELMKFLDYNEPYEI